MAVKIKIVNRVHGYLAFFLLFSYCAPTNAQLGKTNKGQSKSTSQGEEVEEVNFQTEKTIDSTIDSLGIFDSSSARSTTLSGSKNDSDIDLPIAFDFDLQIDYVIDSKEGDTTEYSTLFDRSGDYFGLILPDSKNIVIYDNSQEALFRFLPNQKQYIAISYNESNSYPDYQSENVNRNYRLTKTGNTKNILGYNCYEYLYNDSDYSGRSWITDELQVDIGDFYKEMMKEMRKEISTLFSDTGNGVVMESIIFSKTQGKRQHLVAKNINHSPSSFSTAGYQVSTDR